MPDKMPVDVRRQLRNLGARFLNAAFTEQSLPGFDRLLHFLSWMRLGDGDQLNVISRSARFRRGPGDLRPDALQIFRDRTHAEL